MKKTTLPLLCALAGGVCLAIAAAVCLGLKQGGPVDRLGVAVAVLALGALAVLLLWREGVRRERLLILLLPIGAALLLRAAGLDYIGEDYRNFLGNWYRFFQENGGFRAVAQSVGNYNVPYLYFMAAISYIPAPDLYLIKLFSMLADVVLAWGGLRLVRAVRGASGDRAPLVAFAALLLMPTAVVNSAFWGQCDAVYGALAVHAAAQLLAGKNKSSLLLIAAAFSVKLQTVFLLPLWGVLWAARQVKFRELWLFPLGYAATIVPALLLGKPLKEILGVYVGQMSEYPRLTLNAPSIFQYAPYGTEAGDNILAPLGILAAGLLVAALLAVGFVLGTRLDRRAALSVAVVLVLGVPFLLPHMHERYFFLADAFTVCWACVRARYWPAAVLTGGASLAAYRVFLRREFNYIFTFRGVRYGMPVEAAAMFLALATAAADLIAETRRCRAAALPSGEPCPIGIENEEGTPDEE